MHDRNFSYRPRLHLKPIAVAGFFRGRKSNDFPEANFLAGNLKVNFTVELIYKFSTSIFGQIMFLSNI